MSSTFGVSSKLTILYSTVLIFPSRIEPFGLSSGTPCGGTRGCCGKYLQSGFDEDEFEKAERKERERSQRQNSNSRINGGDTSVSAACDSESVGKAHPIAPLKSKGQVADTVKEQPTAVQTMNATLRAE